MISSTTLLLTAGGLFGLWTASLYIQYVTIKRRVGHLDGQRIFFSAATLVTRFLPDIPGVNRKADWSWTSKYADFEHYGMDILAKYTFYPSPRAGIQIADPHIIKEITSQRSAFPKPVKNYKMLSIFGPNIVGTEGDEWRVHRKVAAKAFDERNNRLVWDEATRIVTDMFSMWDREGGGVEVFIPDTIQVCRNIALMVISAAGFGIRIPWNSQEAVPAGHRMTYQTSLHIASSGLLQRAALPNWILNLYSAGREVKVAYEELGLFMREMIEDRKVAVNPEGDLFSNLIFAREQDKEGLAVFTDSDLMGDIFAFLLAGHETTANTLTFALMLLALYPDVQETFYREICEIAGTSQLLTYTEVPKLKYGLAIIHETLRMFPIAKVIPKVSKDDTQFTVRTSQGTIKTVPVPAGTSLLINMVGLHYNPKYWPNPMEFKPERFLKEYNKDAYLPFSAGARSCIGRRFSEIESLAVLSLIVQTYRVGITNAPHHLGETADQRRERILEVDAMSLTLKCKRSPLTFYKRQ